MNQEQQQGFPYRTTRTAGAEIVRTGDELQFVNLPIAGRRYTNAQIDNYAGLRRRAFPCKPPLRMTVRARFSHRAGELKGTAGFGFWNDPFVVTDPRLPTLPRALWFFYASPPSDMALARDVPGHGWKAATFDALHLRGVGALPFLLLSIPAMYSRRLYTRLWPFFQRSFGVAETPLAVEMTEWHTYTIEWRVGQASFEVDGRSVLTTNAPPTGPLGLVVWLDNQYMVLRPTGAVRFGTVARTEPQWMQISGLEVEYRC